MAKPKFDYNALMKYEIALLLPFLHTIFYVRQLRSCTICYLDSFYLILCTFKECVVGVKAKFGSDIFCEGDNIFEPKIIFLFILS